MSRTFDAYYFANEEQYYTEQAQRQAQINAEWEQWETEHANALIEEPEPRFVLEDGTILTETKKVS